jgi:hypothetical protein
MLGAPLNKNNSNWCVQNTKEEPNGFSKNSPLTSQNKPVWGTCQIMDDNLLSTKLEKTVWVGDDNYQPCDCGFSGVIGFKNGEIFELSKSGSKEPSGCLPYNFWYRDYNGEIKNLTIDKNKISFNIISGTWNWFTEIEMINEKLKITTSGHFTKIQEYNLSTIKFEDFCN